MDGGWLYKQACVHTMQTNRDMEREETVIQYTRVNKT